MAEICTDSRGGVDLSAAVSMIHDWLLTGRLPARGAAEVRKSDMEAAMAWAEGRLRVTVVCDGKVAHVESDYRGAMTLGYRLAPVVIAERHLDGKCKITIAQFARGHLDMAALAQRLNAMEPGWGGSETILASPLGATTNLENAQIIRAIAKTGVTL